MGTRVSEIQEPTEGHCGCYLDSENITEEYITCGKNFELYQPSRSVRGQTSSFSTYHLIVGRQALAMD